MTDQCLNAPPRARPARLSTTPRKTPTNPRLINLEHLKPLTVLWPVTLFSFNPASRAHSRQFCVAVLTIATHIFWFELRRRSFVAILWIYCARKLPFEDRFSAALRYSYRQRAVGGFAWRLVIAIKWLLAIPT